MYHKCGSSVPKRGVLGELGEKTDPEVARIMTTFAVKVPALNGTASCYISYLLNYHTSQRTCRSSSQHLLATPDPRLNTYGERAFAVAAISLWNSIPLKLRPSGSIDTFKRYLETYLFKRAFNSSYFKMIFKLLMSYPRRFL